MNDKIKDCKINLLQKHISNHENIITMSMRVRISLSSCFLCNVYSWATPQVLQEVIIYQFAQNKPRDFIKIFLKPLTLKFSNVRKIRVKRAKTFFLVVLLQSPLDNIARFVSSSRKKGLCGKCIAMRAHRN